MKGKPALLTGNAEDAKVLFLDWSTGHKIVLHVVASLVAHARPRSLVLFDEPEAHLHPPLMAALMHSVRIVLTEVNALCVVATHSPVLLQETLARHVRRVSRIGSSLEVKTPQLETFGIQRQSGCDERVNQDEIARLDFGMIVAISDFCNA